MEAGARNNGGVLLECGISGLGAQPEKPTKQTLMIM
jgi:hypothetical protein